MGIQKEGMSSQQQGATELNVMPALFLLSGLKLKTLSLSEWLMGSSASFLCKNFV